MLVAVPVPLSRKGQPYTDRRKITNDIEQESGGGLLAFPYISDLLEYTVRSNSEFVRQMSLFTSIPKVIAILMIKSVSEAAEESR
jgi:hypothetical protein